MNEMLSILLAAMKEAGDAILTMQKKPLLVNRKANHDIVTDADILANKILKTRLHQADSSIGWLSEETIDDYLRLKKNRIWIVDPIDGTKEYAKGLPEYAISVALVEQGIPILSAIFNPATDELFHAVKNQGAWLNHQKINCKNNSNALHFLASRNEYARGEWKSFSQYTIQQMGSIAYKLGLVAAGYADATLSLSPKSEWDIAAGVLLVSEAGGRVTNRFGEVFLFNRENIIVDGIVASASFTHEKVMNLIIRNSELFG